MKSQVTSLRSAVNERGMIDPKVASVIANNADWNADRSFKAPLIHAYQQQLSLLKGKLSMKIQSSNSSRKAQGLRNQLRLVSQKSKLYSNLGRLYVRYPEQYLRKVPFKMMQQFDSDLRAGYLKMSETERVLLYHQCINKLAMSPSFRHQVDNGDIKVYPERSVKDGSQE